MAQAARKLPVAPAVVTAAGEKGAKTTRNEELRGTWERVPLFVWEKREEVDSGGSQGQIKCIRN